MIHYCGCGAIVNEVKCTACINNNVDALVNYNFDLLSKQRELINTVSILEAKNIELQTEISRLRGKV
jgi:hypothetical protein